MNDKKADGFQSQSTCTGCGHLVNAGSVDSQGRCASCRQSAESFLDEFSISLGRWAAGLKKGRLGPGPEPEGAKSTVKIFTIRKVVLAMLFVMVGFSSYYFITNYHLTQAQWFLEQGQIDKARFHLEKAAEAGRDESELRFVIGNLYYHEGKMGPAIDAYCQTLEIDSLHAGALNNLAWIYTREKVNLDRALLLSRRSLELEPDNPNYLDTMAEVCLLKKQYSRALGYIRRAVEQNPPNLEYYLRRLEKIKRLAQDRTQAVEV
ncbi:MAG: tetratricopeptide repeat protein [Gemmatimonadota bacterium]|nr:tetratricopeptide repeat protein [Gemmatimonadota bacterium]